jgi:hypothetical protein
MEALAPTPKEYCRHPPRSNTISGLTERSDLELMQPTLRHRSPPQGEGGLRAGAQVLTQSCGHRFKPVLSGTCAP